MYYDIVHHIYVTGNQELAHEHELLSPIPELHEEKPHPELRNENYLLVQEYLDQGKIWPSGK